MKVLRFILQKEFRQIFRDKTILAMMLAVPCVQLIILPLAMDFEVKNVNVSIVDHDHSAFSQKLLTKIASSGYFKLISRSEEHTSELQSLMRISYAVFRLK